MEMQANAHYNLIIREWLNGSLLPLSLSLTFIIGVFLFNNWRGDGGGWTLRWTKRRGIKVSCALFWLFAAESIRAGTVWALLRIANDNQRVTDILDFFVNVGFIAGAIALIGAFLRCNFLFTPQRWGHWYWVASLIVTILFLILSEIFPPFPLPYK